MVTCTGAKHAIHHYKPYSKLKRCPIQLKAVLSSNNTVIPEGYGLLHICFAYGYHRVLVYYHPSITGTLLSPTSIIGSAKDPNENFTGQSIQRWFNNDTTLTGNMMLISHHCLSKSYNIVIHGCLFGGQLYMHHLLLPAVPPCDSNNG